MAKYILRLGVKLADDDDWHLRRSGSGAVVTDRPYTEAKDVIGGRVIITLAPHRSRGRPDPDAGWRSSTRPC